MNNEQIQNLLNQVQTDFKITPEQLLGSSRDASLVDARCLIALILRLIGLSYPQIGRILGRDHTTIINLIKRANKKNLNVNFYLKKYRDIFRE